MIQFGGVQVRPGDWIIADGSGVVVIAQEHVGRLTPSERRRVLQLVRIGRGRTRNLNARERAELEDLVSKAEPRLFLATAMHRLSPMPVPRPLVDRLVGARRRRA